MSWVPGLFSKASASSANGSSVPATTHLQLQRLKQIKSLYALNQNVIEVERDVSYKLVFQTGGNTITLAINLPPQFPNDRPVVTVSPAMKHEWVNSSMKVVGCSPLNSFYMHSDLGKIIQQIVQHFKKIPPAMIPSESPLPPVPPGFASSPSTYSKPTASSYEPPKSESTLLENEQPPPYEGVHNLVSVSRAVGGQDSKEIMRKVEKLSKEELEELLASDDLAFNYVKENPWILDMQEERKRLMKENERLARENASMEPELDEQKGRLKAVYEEYCDLLNSFQEKARKQEELIHIYDIGCIATNLRIGALQAEEESEKIAHQFLCGGIKLDAFMGSFIEKRTICHSRRAKEERLKFA